ncbi:unnamed protein product [Porites evermanni]|uniref:USP domain-containing protein n=1 Tax=Porites evermanni TaxID=104178 RepID=A0ABN8Q2J1_9CNID|nr:unnamed protein product [Porites evermanni]
MIFLYQARVIPLQLQKLFAKLLLLNQDSIGTTDLTDSFGWAGNEGFQQHDVQELNRILFSALESSLIGTPGAALIRKLYHGTSVTKVICKECGRVSEREENYLDLPLILSGCNGLEQSLEMSYVSKENLEGANKYKCGSCGKLVNAIKGSKIRTLPPILTFSLLRFNYDFQRGERFKETKRYTFPVALSMREFCESNKEIADDQEYELFSVVIHGGSCYGGHYHAYIRDVEGLRTWFEPDKEQVRIVQGEDDSQENVVVNSGDPVELIVALLRKLGGAASVNQLCQCMSKDTGISWNKRFKSRFGPLSKFFKRNSDIFSFSDACGWVSLKNAGENPSGRASTQREVHRPLENDLSESAQSVIFSFRENVPEQGHMWFDVNDSRISCIRERDLQRQFSGKESAYMLFYRRKNLLVTGIDPILSVPTSLRTEVEELNKKFSKEREDYDARLNQISVTVHFASYYIVSDGFLRIKQGLTSEPLIVSLDRRKPVTDLLRRINELDPSRDNEASSTVHIARRLPAGLHLFQEVIQHPEKSLIQSGVHDGTEVFLWNGDEVGGSKVYTGEDWAPVLLNIKYSVSEDEAAVEIQKTFRKNTTLGEMKLMLCSSIGINYEDLLLSWVKSKIKNKVCALNADKDGDTLNEICLQDGDYLVAEKKIHIESNVKSKTTLSSQENKKHDNLFSFTVEIRCVETATLEDKENKFPRPVFPVQILKDQTIGDLKTKVLRLQSQFQHISETVCRFRVDDDFQGLSPPLYDHEKVSESWLKEGQKLVLESGAPLLPEEIMIRFYVSAPSHTRQEMEQVVSNKITVGECLRLLTEIVNLEGRTWHLRKTNWIGEPADSLDNEDETLENANVKNGDTLIIEEGRLPPKGFIRLSLWQVRCGKTNEQTSLGVNSQIRTPGSALTVETSMLTHCNSEGTQCDTECLVRVGDIEISEETALYDLKMQISTLPQLADHLIPTPGFLRLQEVVDGQQTRVLRGINRTLRQMKLTSSTQLSIRVLQHEEDLSPSAVLLKLRRKFPGERRYYAEQEVIFDPTEAVTPTLLRHFVSKISDIPLDQLNIAKYFPAKYDWLVIRDKPGQQGKQKGAKNKINLRRSPFYLQDGDIIGVKDCKLDSVNRDDFSTPADDEGKERLRQKEEEKKHRRKNNRARRPEVPLTIHVDDFR